MTTREDMNMADSRKSGATTSWIAEDATPPVPERSAHETAHDVVSFPIQRQEAELLLRALVFSVPPEDPAEQKIVRRLLDRLKFITGIKAK